AIATTRVYDAHAKGIFLYTQDASGGSVRNVVVNNTFLVANDGGAPLRLGSQASDNTIFNNVFNTARADWPWVDADTNALPGTKIDYNVTGQYEFINGSNASSAWTSTYGFDAHSVVADPTAVFVNPAANDYRLKAGSPAINVGVAIFNGKAAPGQDLPGDNPPVGGAYDDRADEDCGW